MVSSLRSSISQIRFLILALFIYKYINHKEIKLIIYFIASIILFVALDNNLQFLTGIDIFGFKAEGYIYDKRSIFLDKDQFYTIGRLSGPFEEELRSGSFIAKLSFPIFFYLGHIFKNSKKTYKFLIILFFVIILESVIITGERSSTLIIISSFILSIYFSFGIKNTLKVLLPFILCFIIAINFNDFLKFRTKDSISIVKNIPESSYGVLYQSAIRVWKKNVYTGVGLKNFRINCKYVSEPEINKFPSCSTHPHNVLLEILSETGIIGLFIFLLFLIFFTISFRKFYKKQEIVHLKYISLGSFYMIVVSLLPLYPSGSIFSTWNATLLWINFGISLFIKKNK